MMTTSETLNELAAALAKAQGQMAGAKKDRENPHFRSKYADLASVWDACRAALSANGLSVIQSPGFDHTEHGVTVPVETLLMHTSGQWVRGVIAVPVSKVDAHGVGSANTYGRRYALAAFVGIAPEDDDGVAAVGQGAARVTTAAPEPPKAPKGYDAWMTDFISAADEGMDAMKAAWKASDPAIRAWAEAHDRAALTGIKGKAAKVRQVVAS